MSMRHLVLAGAGHAQLELLAALAREGVPPGWHVSMVTPQPAFHYSGMLPAIIAGAAPVEAADIPVAAIARAAGITVHVDTIVALEAPAKRVTLSGGMTLDYDLLSLDVGSVPAATHVSGVMTQASVVRPFSAALAMIAHLDARCAASPACGELPIVVVGAGAAGVEIAFAVRARVLAASRVPRVVLLDAAADDGLPLPGFALPARQHAARALARRDIVVRNATVAAVTPTTVEVETGRRRDTIPSRLTAWVTGAAAHPWLAASGLSCDRAGFPFASSTLVLDPAGTVYGGGDCITLRDAASRPRAGVYAVRMAPVLAENVLAVMRGAAPRATFVPQRDFLALLSTGDGKALLRWRGVALESRWAQRLKDRIDGAYLARYRALPS